MESRPNYEDGEEAEKEIADERRENHSVFDAIMEHQNKAVQNR